MTDAYTQIRQGVNSGSDCVFGSTSIASLPDEVLEGILELLCPYTDYHNCSLVCSRWHHLISGVAHRRQRCFELAVKEGVVKWTRLKRERVPLMITDRHSHCVCYAGASLYVFGGCTASQTTFNDLWRLDLSTRQWMRLTASGTYPSPKACSSMVVWRNQLILYGGWSQPTPFPLHQGGKFFNQLHVYDIECNSWSAISSTQLPPAVAGHSSCILLDKMIVFGGSHHLGNSSDALWQFDLMTSSWKELIADDSNNCKPLPRYGAFMCSVNEKQAVLLGGCGGPNMKFSDCWLLTLCSSTYIWTQLKIRNVEHSCPPPLWCHPCCKVGQSLVILSKTSLPVDSQVLSRISLTRTHNVQHTSTTSEALPSSEDEEIGSNVRPRTNRHPKSTASVNITNPQLKRQKQLAMLEKYERKLRSQRNVLEVDHQSLLKNPMFLHSLDISTVDGGYVSWNAPNLVDVYGEVAEETVFYSLTEGRGELIMVGGAHPDKEQGMQRSAASSSSQTLNDSVYIINAT